MSTRFFWFIVVLSIGSSAFADLVKTDVGGQITWSDDFLRGGGAGTEFVNYYYDASAYCDGAVGSPPDYTPHDRIDTEVHYQSALIGGGKFKLSSLKPHTFIFPAGQWMCAAVGWMNLQWFPACSGLAPPGFESDIPFDDNDLCIYGGFEFASWHLRHGDPNGADGAPGYAGVDDDGDGITDFVGADPDIEEYYGWNLKINGGGAVSPQGPDGGPGIAGFDDDGNGIIDDDLNERGFGDDADDNQGEHFEMITMRDEVGAGSAVGLGIFPGTSLPSNPQVFMLVDMQILYSFDQQVGSDEIGVGFYDSFPPGTQFNYSFCAVGTSYGASLWVEDDWSNPVETLGPMIATGHSGTSVQWHCRR